ncbi:MAG TPA: hypothetical protein VGN59_06740 [Acidimicrobiia bacterium]|jgi:hypothetical protein
MGSAWSVRVAVGALAIVAAGCFQPVGPARTFHDYELKAESTAKSARSSVETARLAVQVATDGDAFPPYVSVLLAEAESDASNSQGTFLGIQPPDKHSDRLRDRLGRLLEQTGNVLSTLRITARRADLQQLKGQAARLPALSKRLDRFATEHE